MRRNERKSGRTFVCSLTIAGFFFFTSLCRYRTVPFGIYGRASIDIVLELDDGGDRGKKKNLSVSEVRAHHQRRRKKNLEIVSRFPSRQTRNERENRRKKKM